MLGLCRLEDRLFEQLVARKRHSEFWISDCGETIARIAGEFPRLIVIERETGIQRLPETVGNVKRHSVEKPPP